MSLNVKGLKTYYFNHGRVIKALDGIGFSLAKGETLGLVGDSGSGKSTLGYSIMGYLPPSAKIVGGAISFKGIDLVKNSQRLRWREIAIIFQGAMNALNPLMKIGEQMEDVLRFHMKLNKKQRRKRINELMNMVQLDPEKTFDYPHQLSGGMKQRVMIAMALACNPSILIADEPTSNLDVITQKNIMDLLILLKEKLGLSVIHISHDLALIFKSCKQVVVLCKGRVVEAGFAVDILRRPEHPYTRQLVNSIPKIKRDGKHEKRTAYT